jgi:uncharacterized iron-regulated membrane protein
MPPPSGERAPLTDLTALVQRAETVWGNRPAGSVTVTNPGDRRAVIEVRQARGLSLATGRNSAQSLRFDGVSGQPLDVIPPSSPSVVQSISNVFMMLHRGFFASPVPRWLLFLAGVGGSLMIATGLAMWSVARVKDRETTGRIPFGQRLVEVLNVSGIAGLMIATGAYFWANRLIPVDFPQRNEWEINVFFYAWAISVVYALVCKYKTAWIEELAFAGVVIALLPYLNAFTGGLSLFGSLYLGQWVLAGFDLCALAIGGGLIFAARKVYQHHPRHRVAKQDAAPEAVASPAAGSTESAPSPQNATPPEEPLFPSFIPLQAEEGI